MTKYEKFHKVDKDSYQSINDFLKEHSLLTTREWMVSEILCDFREEGSGSVPMTEVGEKLPNLFPFMDKKYSASEISNSKNSLEKKVQRAGTTFLYAIRKGCFTQEKIEDLIINIATGIESVQEVLDEEMDDDFVKRLPDELNSIIGKVKEVEEGNLVDLEEPLFGRFVEGELGSCWREKINSNKFGEVLIELSFDRILSEDDILVPDELTESEKFLELNHGYGYWDNGRHIERYCVEVID